MNMNVERLREILARRLEPTAYSGRHMYGSHCLSVTTRRGETIYALLAEVVSSCDGVDEAAEILRRVQTDTMGMGMVAYWPDFKLHAHS